MTIEEALNQAEIISDDESDESWVRIEKYPYKSFYEDEEETFIDLEKREISDPSKNVSTLGENNSQLITFVMDRYADGVDLVDMLIQIQYRLQNGEEATAGPVNVYASDDKIKFGWAISNIQTQVVQTIQFIVYCTGKLADGESYLLKTKPMSYRIENSLGISGVIAEPDEDWFLQFENAMNEKLNQVITLANSAVQSATSANASEEATTQAAATVSNLASQVRADAESAKESEENAEEWYNRTVEHSGVGYASKERAGVVSPQDVYVNPENGNMHMITATTSTTQPNSYAGREMVLEIGGVTEQDSTAGNQLFKFADGLNILVTGVTGKDNGDGTFSLKGTSTASAGLFVLGNEYYGSNAVFTLKAGTYYVSGIPSNIGFFLYKTGSEVSPVAVYAPGGSFTLAEDTDFSSISLRWTNNVTFNESVVKIMLNAGNTALPYEPYTGGQPAPNPSYPMEIKKSVVSGVKTHGKNELLCAIQNDIHTTRGLTFTVKRDANGGIEYINVNGTSTEQIIYVLRSGVTTPKGRVITGCTGGSSNTYSILITYNDANGIWKGERYQVSDELLIDYTYPKHDIAILIRNGVTLNNVKFYPMVREAGTDATYEPYTESSYTFSQPIELYGMNDVQDVIDVKARVVRRRTKAKTISNVTLMDSQGLLGGIALEDNVVDYNGSNIMCDSFNEFDYVGGLRQKDYGLTIYNKYLYIRNADVEQTVSGYTEWLASNPITVVYELATPTTEALPIADQIGLNSLATYDGITYVEFIYEGPQPTLKAEYGTSKVGGYTLESLLIARNNELRLTALEETNEEV